MTDATLTAATMSLIAAALEIETPATTTPTSNPECTTRQPIMRRRLNITLTKEAGELIEQVGDRNRSGFISDLIERALGGKTPPVEERLEKLEREVAYLKLLAGS